MIIVILIFGFQRTNAHESGGEITWECLGNGYFIFEWKKYHSCWPSTLTVPSFTTNSWIRIYNHPTLVGSPVLANIPMTLVSLIDITPQCNAAFQGVNCQLLGPDTLLQLAIFEGIYRSDTTYIPGIPPTQGWVFSTSVSCCRVPMVNFPTTQPYGTDGGLVYSKMYPYNGSTANPCFDSSPKFLEKPVIFGCTVQNFKYTPNAFDPDGDSLSFAFDSACKMVQVWPGGPYIHVVAVPYAPGYGWQNPLPNGSIDPSTGEITFSSNQPGAYGVTVKVSSFKSGQLISEVIREMRFTLVDCMTTPNNPPVVTAPFENPPGSGNYIFSDTVYAGDVVNFQLPAIDTDFLPNNLPQTITLTASGSQFGSGFTDPNTGCVFPPCATLNPPLPISQTVGTYTEFNWQTGCNHIPATQNSYTYSFVFTAKDDFCPVPGLQMVVVNITVLALPQIPAPDLRCVSIDNATGDISLQWLPPPDSLNSFSNYFIYSGSLIDSLNNLTPGSYIHTNGLQQGSNNYFVVTKSGCSGNLSAVSVTMQPIIVSAVGGNGIANISWNALHTPPLATSQPYNVYREYPAGNWSLIGTTTQTNFIDSLNLCGDSVKYRIEQPDQSGCVSISSIATAYIFNNTAPASINLDSVSVTSQGYATIGWDAGNNYSSTVWQYNGSGWDSLTTIYGSGAQSFINNNSQANTTTETYAITVADSCGNMSVISPQQNTLLPLILADNCLGDINLSWQPYINLPSSITGYEIWQSINGNLFSQEGFITNTNYNDDGFNSGDSVCYFIRMMGANGTTSTSPVVCTTILKAEEPAIYLRYATVENNNVIIAWGADSISTGFKIIRKERSNNTPFDTLATVAATQLNYTDATAEINSISYEYKIIAVDSCGNDRSISNSAITILLEAEKKDLFSSLIKWNEYGDWPTGVEKYVITRNGEEINSLQNNAYIDNFEAAFHLPSPFCYRIIAIENAGNPLNYKDYSNSNIVCIEIESNIYLPNAFTPGGINPVFKPVTSFLSHDNYSFAVYNRWGERIFYTNNPQNGWDGNYKGEKAPAGIYIYQLNTDKIKNKKGFVSLLR